MCPVHVSGGRLRTTTHPTRGCDKDTPQCSHPRACLHCGLLTPACSKHQHPNAEHHASSSPRRSSSTARRYSRIRGLLSAPGCSDTPSSPRAIVSQDGSASALTATLIELSP